MITIYLNTSTEALADLDRGHSEIARILKGLATRIDFEGLPPDRYPLVDVNGVNCGECFNTHGDLGGYSVKIGRGVKGGLG